MKFVLVRGFEEVKDILAPAVKYTINRIKEHIKKEGQKLNSETRLLFEEEKDKEIEELQDSWVFLQENYGKDVDYSNWFIAMECMASALNLYLKHVQSELEKINLNKLYERKKRAEEVLMKYYQDIPRDKYLLYFYIDE